MTVALIGGQVENIDSDECMDTDMQTPSDILAFQLRWVIQEKEQGIHKKGRKNLRTGGFGTQMKGETCWQSISDRWI